MDRIDDDADHMLPPTCGNCRFSAPADETQIACYGAPPVPVIVGARKNVLGQTEPQIMSMRPILKRTERACALFQPQRSVLLAGRG